MGSTFLRVSSSTPALLRPFRQVIPLSIGLLESLFQSSSKPISVPLEINGHIGLLTRSGLSDNTDTNYKFGYQMKFICSATSKNCTLRAWISKIQILSQLRFSSSEPQVDPRNRWHYRDWYKTKYYLWIIKYVQKQVQSLKTLIWYFFLKGLLHFIGTSQIIVSLAM